MIDFSTLKTLATKFTVTGAQKAHIDRLVFELGVQEKEAVKTIAEKDVSLEKATRLEQDNAVLKERISTLKAKVEGFESQLAAITANEDANDQSFQILCALFDHGPYMELPAIQNMFQLSRGETEFHLDKLKKRDLIVKRPAIMRAMKSVPVTAGILDTGRALVMKCRSKQ